MVELGDAGTPLHEAMLVVERHEFCSLGKLAAEVCAPALPAPTHPHCPCSHTLLYTRPRTCTHLSCSAGT